MSSTSDWAPVYGKTYLVREKLKLLGGRYDATRKLWSVPAKRLEEANELVRNAPVGVVDQPLQSTKCRGCRSGIRDTPNGRASKFYCGNCRHDEVS